MGVDLSHCTYTPLDDRDDLHFPKVRTVYPGLYNNVVLAAYEIDPPGINKEDRSREVSFFEHELILVN